jgi:hypothetical protein
MRVGETMYGEFSTAPEVFYEMVATGVFCFVFFPPVVEVELRASWY